MTAANYQWGSPAYQPSVAPTLDQAGQVIDFLDRLGARQTESNRLPMQSSGSVSQFQQTPVHLLRQQESQYANLQSSTNSEQGLHQKLQIVSNGLNALYQQCQLQEQLINQLLPFVQTSQIWMEDALAHESVVNQLLPFVQTSQIWMEDALAHEQVLDNFCYFMSNPDALLPWAFLVWENAVNLNSQEAISYVGDRFLELIEKYENIYMAANNGDHSPMWLSVNNRQTPDAARVLYTQQINSGLAVQPPVLASQHQPQMPMPQPQMPMPPIPGGSQIIDPIQARINIYKSGDPDAGRKLQYAHLAQRRGYI